MRRFRFGHHELLAAATALCLSAGVASAQDIIWTQRYDSGQDYYNEAFASATSPDGAVVVTGYSYGVDYNPDIATVKMRMSDGEILWSRRWTANSTSDDGGTDVAVDDSGNVFVTGASYTPTDSMNFVTIRYRSDGTQVWAVQYNSAQDSAVAVVPDGTGGCYVCGTSSAGGLSDFLAIRYDSLGAEVWVARVNGPLGGNDSCHAMALDPASGLYLAGAAIEGPAASDYLVVKLDCATGDTLWTRTYDGRETTPDDDAAYAAALDPAGNIVVTGIAGEMGTWYDATTVKYAPDGTQLWVNRFDAGRNSEDEATAIAIDRDGNIVCAGMTLQYFYDSENDFLVFSIPPDGGPANWQYVWDEGNEDDDQAVAVVCDESGNAYACGNVNDLWSSADWYVVKLDRQGVPAWSAHHGVFDDDDFVHDLDLDEFGCLYVTGFDLYEGSAYYATMKFSEDDVGAWRVVAPADTVVKGDEIVPQVWVRNYSARTQSFPVWIGIGGFYYDGQTVSNLAPFDSALVTFTPWEVRDVGYYTVRTYTLLPGDRDPANDTTEGVVLSVYPPGWVEVASMPLQPSAEEVKRGGWLTFDASTDLLYGAKGNKTGDFYSYDMREDTWSSPLADVPYGSRQGRTRPPDKGTKGIADGSGHIYLTSGSNTLSFWRYDITTNTWEMMPDVPEGWSGKNIKGGNSMAFVTLADTGYVYLLKGYKTEFYRFNTAARRWETLTDAPGTGIKDKWQRGSWIVYDGDRSIYAHAARYYNRATDHHYMFKYDIPGDTWYSTGLPGMPLLGQHGRRVKRKKAKDGSQGAWFDGRIYALKGGNTQMFYGYDAAANTWTELETIPKQGRLGDKKRVKYGGGLVYADLALWAMKGNRTNELWRSGVYLGSAYGGEKPGRSGVAALDGPRRLELRAAPNPFADRTVLSYNLPRAGRVRLSLYDAAGRCARVLADGWRAAGAHRLTLADEGLATGVYLAKLTITDATGTRSATQKVLVAR